MACRSVNALCAVLSAAFLLMSPASARSDVKSDAAAFISKVEAVMRECRTAFQDLDKAIAAKPDPSALLVPALMAKTRCERAKDVLQRMEAPLRLPKNVRSAFAEWSDSLSTAARYLAQVAFGATLYVQDQSPGHISMRPQRAAIKVQFARADDYLQGAKEEAGLLVRRTGDALGASKSYLALIGSTIEPCELSFNVVHADMAAGRMPPPAVVEGAKTACEEADYKLGPLMAPRSIPDKQRYKLHDYRLMVQSAADIMTRMARLAGRYVTRSDAREIENYRDLIKDYEGRRTAVKDVLAGIESQVR